MRSAKCEISFASFYYANKDIIYKSFSFAGKLTLIVTKSTLFIPNTSL